MLKFLIILSLIFFSFILLNSSGWIKNYGIENYNEIGIAIAAIDSGYYYIAGTTNSSGAGFYDGYLMKIDSTGDSLFTKTYGGSEEDRFQSITVFQDTLLIFAGWSNSFGSGDYDVYLVCTDLNGNTVWTRTYGGSGDDQAYQVVNLADGNLLVAGFTKTSPGGDQDIYLIKINPDGDSIWSAIARSAGHDVAYGVCQLSNGNIVTCGYTQAWGKGFKDVLLVGFTDQGDSLWAKTLGGGYDDWANSIINIDNFLFIGGSTESSGNGYWDNYVIKCTVDGDSLWAKTYGGLYREEIRQLEWHFQDEIWFTGWTESFGPDYTNIMLTSIDTAGNENWFRYYGTFSYERGNALISTSDRGGIMVGEIWDINWDDYNLYLIKTDSQGFTTGVEEQINSLTDNLDSSRNQNFIVNPGGNILRFNLHLENNPLIKIFDLSGRNILIQPMEKLNQDQYQVNIKLISPGVYFYRIEDGIKEIFGKITVTE